MPYHEALEMLRNAAIPTTKIESVDVSDALQRVLAKPVVAHIDVPPADNSAMDGYAIRSSDIGKCSRLPISQHIPAGTVGEPLLPGTVARILTGAPIPVGADTVVMQEQVTVEGEKIVIHGQHRMGQHIRLVAEDIAAGTEILTPGIRLRGQELGAAASIGYSRLEIFKRLKVAVFSTGDELIDLGQPLGPGQIYGSNRYTIIGMLKTLGCEFVDLGIIGDTLDATIDALNSATDEADLVITSGGVSVGDEDHVRKAVKALGSLQMWRVKVKPGKPLAFGQINNTPFLGLPGNPVAVFVTFCLFVSPFIKRMQGMTRTRAQSMPITAGFEWTRPSKRREFVRARIGQNGSAHPIAEIYSNQGSGVLASTTWSDGLVMIPEGATVTKGDSVEYTAFEHWLV